MIEEHLTMASTMKPMSPSTDTRAVTTNPRTSAGARDALALAPPSPPLYKTLSTSAAAPALLFSLALFAFWLRSSVVVSLPSPAPLCPPQPANTNQSVLFSLISETFLREHSRLFLFLKVVFWSLGLLIPEGTVSLLSHFLELYAILFH